MLLTYVCLKPKIHKETENFHVYFDIINPNRMYFKSSPSLNIEHSFVLDSYFILRSQLQHLPHGHPITYI